MSNARHSVIIDYYYLKMYSHRPWHRLWQRLWQRLLHVKWVLRNHSLICTSVVKQTKIQHNTQYRNSVAVHASVLTERKREMFYLTTHSTHFIYGYMASDIWLRTILIVRKETRCRHIGYSYRLTASVLLYAPSHIQDSTYHGLCYTSREALAGTRNISMGPPHEGSTRRPIAP